MPVILPALATVLLVAAGGLQGAVPEASASIDHVVGTQVARTQVARTQATPEDVLVVEPRAGRSASLIDLAPGDSTEWAADVTNTAPAPNTIDIAFETTGSDPLTKDAVSSLDLVVDLCRDRLEEGETTEGAVVFTCPGTERRLATGAASCLGRVTANTVLGAGETAGVRVRVSLPASADNSFENTRAELVVRFGVAAGGAPVPDDPDDCGAAEPSPTQSPAPTASAGPTASAQPTTSAEPTTSAGPFAGEPPAAGRPQSGGGLPFTGADLAALISGATLALATGLALLAAGHRRRRSSGGGRS